MASFGPYVSLAPSLQSRNENQPLNQYIYDNIHHGISEIVEVSTQDQQEQEDRDARPSGSRRKIFKGKSQRYTPPSTVLKEDSSLSAEEVTINEINPITITKPQVTTEPLSSDTSIISDKIQSSEEEMPTSIIVQGSLCITPTTYKQVPIEEEIIRPAIAKLNVIDQYQNESDGVEESSQVENLNKKIDNLIEDTYRKISAGATTHTIAHLNDEFGKFIQRLRARGHKMNEQTPTKKPTSIETATSIIPEPAKLKCSAESSPQNIQCRKITDDDMIPIGLGYAKIPARLWRNMKWASYTNCTRKLMSSVFPRRILATHSLTGKRSPAFPNKAPKKMLNSKLINDIIQTVVDKCGVTEGQVRVCVTTKCADESKMLRTRKNKFQSKNKHDESGSEADSE